MRLTRKLIPIAVIFTLLLTATATALPEVYDAEDDPRFIDLGYDVLTIDYLAVWDNLVVRTGADYPRGRLWLILYDPGPYENEDLMEEDKWNRSHELDRFELPGPSRRESWENDDAVAYRNMGVYEWRGGENDRIVFRIIVEEPSGDLVTDTLMWGTIYEDDSYEALEFGNDSLSVFFRTLDLPETFLQPSAEFTDIWMQHDARMGNQDGIEIHSEFQIDNVRSRVNRISVYVHTYRDDRGVRCQIDDPLYMTPSGLLTVQEDFMPYYTSTIFNDFVLFIPYDAFPESDDYVDYYVDIEILDEDWEVIGAARSRVFSVLRPE